MNRSVDDDSIDEYDEMLDIELEEALVDAEGESSACQDIDCACHKRPNRIREELEWRRTQS